MISALVIGTFEKVHCLKSKNLTQIIMAPTANGVDFKGWWWISLGIKIDRDDPGHPEQNGAHKRMYRDMKKELQNKVSGDL
ncbi:MAG: transposase [Treponema sp.]|jgi:transposase InsO family protein|nr:transposase [Treponema sp.]